MFYPTPPLLWDAWDRCKTVLLSEDGYTWDQRRSGINISSIQSRIINEVGRFAESFASDALYELETISDLLSEHMIEPGEDCIIPFGIRRTGVDGTRFLMQRLISDCRYPTSGYLHPERCYRKILGVRIKIGVPPESVLGLPFKARASVELKDLTDAFVKTSDADLAWTWETACEARADFLDGVAESLEPGDPAETTFRNLAECYRQHLIAGMDRYVHETEIQRLRRGDL